MSSLGARIYEHLDLMGVADAGDTEGFLEECICIKNFGASWPSIPERGEPHPQTWDPESGGARASLSTAGVHRTDPSPAWLPRKPMQR